MKAVVIFPFVEKGKGKKTHAKGEIVDFDDDRVATLVARGFLRKVEESESKTDSASDTGGKKVKAKAKAKSESKTDSASDTAQSES